MFHVNPEKCSFPNAVALQMPLFFLVSGNFFKACEPKTFFIKKINNILVPFLFWLIVSDIWHIMCTLWATHDISLDNITIIQFAKHPLSRIISFNIVLWFLICLFITNMIFYAVYTIFSDNKYRSFAVFFLASIGYFLFLYKITLPLWIDTSLVALPFFFLGYYCRNLSYLKPEFSLKKSLFLGIGLILVSYVIYFASGRSCINDMRTNSFYGSPVMGYLNSVMFVMGGLLLCKVINWLPIISYFGRYSIIVLCIHFPLILFVPNFIERRTGYEVNDWELAAIILLICWFAIPVCKRFLPYFVAQKPLIKMPSEKAC